MPGFDQGCGIYGKVEIINPVSLTLITLIVTRAGKLRKAVIPGAGMGTRLLSVTKEQPKEMLPVFAKSKNGDICLKPVVQLVFEELYLVGFREFCFAVGKGKRAIEDHFTPDHSFVSLLKERNLTRAAEELKTFYRMIEGSTLFWVNQPEPLGFGDAVLKARSFAGNDRFVVHAGDSFFVSRRGDHLRRLIKLGSESNTDAIFLSRRVEDPRRFGVILGDTVSPGQVKVNQVIEKPARTISKLAIMPVYVFDPRIFKALESNQPGVAGELQLTDGIQKLVEWKYNVFATEVGADEIWLDIGSPDLYWEAQALSHEFCTSSRHGQIR